MNNIGLHALPSAAEGDPAQLRVGNKTTTLMSLRLALLARHWSHPSAYVSIVTMPAHLMTSSLQRFLPTVPGYSPHARMRRMRPVAKAELILLAPTRGSDAGTLPTEHTRRCSRRGRLFGWRGSDDAWGDLRDDAWNRACDSCHTCRSRGNRGGEAAGAQPAAGACRVLPT